MVVKSIRNDMQKESNGLPPFYPSFLTPPKWLVSHLHLIQMVSRQCCSFPCMHLARPVFLASQRQSSRARLPLFRKLLLLLEPLLLVKGRQMHRHVNGRERVALFRIKSVRIRPVRLLQEIVGAPLSQWGALEFPVAPLLGGAHAGNGRGPFGFEWTRRAHLEGLFDGLVLEQHTVEDKRGKWYEEDTKRLRKRDEGESLTVSSRMNGKAVRG